MCHVDDSVILGAWLQETDHKDIEDQVGVGGAYYYGATKESNSSLPCIQIRELGLKLSVQIEPEGILRSCPL